MTMQTMQIRINQGLTQRLDNLIKNGIYQNRSEAIRDAVRRLVLKEMIGIIENKENSVKQIRATRKKLSNQKFNLDEINNLMN
jgi:antitoxin ParD1/3/4